VFGLNKKKTWIVFGILILLGVILFIQFKPHLNVFNIISKTNEQIILSSLFTNSDTEGIDFEFEKGNYKTEIRNSSNSGIDLWVWGETSMQVDLPARLNEYIVQDEEGKITINFSSFSAEMYMLGDSFEFEIALGKKPPINYISFPIKMVNMECYFQLPLNVEYNDYTNCNETSCWNGSRIFMDRPENVVNSYACYHNSKANNKYMTGKAFHIYRIKAYDSGGKSVWGNIEITPTSMKITIPQSFLDSAIYPVKIDPTFGYSSNGASSSDMGLASVYAHNDTARSYNASAGDNVTRYNFYGRSDDGVESVKMAAYNRSAGSIKYWASAPTTVSGIGIGAVAWYGTNVNNSLNAGDNYIVAVGNATSEFTRIYYDSATGSNNTYKLSSGLTNPFTTGTSPSILLYSIYVNYTIGVGGDTTPPNYSANSTNSTIAGTNILHNLYWEDDTNLSGYIFGFCNGTYNKTTLNVVSNSYNATAIYYNSTQTGAGVPVVITWSEGWIAGANNSGTTQLSSVSLSDNVNYTLTNSASNAEGLIRINFTIQEEPAEIDSITITGEFNNPMSGGTGEMNAMYVAEWDAEDWVDIGGADRLIERTETVTYTNSTEIANIINNGQIVLLFEAGNLDNGETLTVDYANIIVNTSTESYSDESCADANPTFVNDSWVAMTGTTNSSNVTKGVTATVGATIKWYIWANDSSNNANMSSIFTYVTTSGADTTPPTFTAIANITQNNETAVYYDINATDTSGLETFWINDTTNFKIDGTTGVFENKTSLNVSIYWVNVSVNDTIGNIASQVIYVNLTAVAGDTCTCPNDDATNWEVDMEDYCIINDNCLCANLTFINAGNFTCNAIINAYSVEGLSTGQIGYVMSNCRGIGI
jgi:hypothetical protein